MINITKRDALRLLRNNLIKRYRGKVLKVYLIGSYAKGLAKVTSDIDVAVVIEPRRYKTSLQFTEDYHSAFRSERFVPRYGHNKIDFQFFFGYPDGSNEVDVWQAKELK